MVFNGDGYSENWQIEAAERGLPNFKTTLHALPSLITPESVQLFEKYSVFNERELHSRYEVRLEQYALTIGVEAKLTLEIGSTVVLPAAVRYQTELAQNVAALKKAGVAPSTALLEEVSGPIAELTAALADLKGALTDHSADSAYDEASARARCVAAGDGRGACRGRRAGRRCGRRSVAFAHLSGDALHPLIRRRRVWGPPVRTGTGNPQPHTRRSSAPGWSEAIGISPQRLVATPSARCGLTTQPSWRRISSTTSRVEIAYRSG